MQPLPHRAPHHEERRSDVLAMLLAPSTPTEFLERYFEKEPLHIGRGDPKYFRDVYDVAEIESSLVVGGSDHDKFVLIKHGVGQVSTDDMVIERRHPRARHTGRTPKLVLDPRVVVSYFDRGYTLVIKDGSQFSPKLQKFVNRVQQRLGFYIQTNVYFTPPKAQGFDIHHDTHDTLVMQIEGTKTWRIYDPVVQLPVETQPYSKEEHGKLVNLNREVTLNPGDTLYVPHGFPHEAMTAEGKSLHVTLAMCPLRVIDLLEAMIDFAAVTDVELRRALPPGWHESKDFPARFVAMLQERLPKALPAAHVPPASEMILRDLFAVTRTEAGGSFDEWERFVALGPTNTLAMRDDVPFMLRRAGQNIELLVAGKSLGYPIAYAPLFEKLQAGPMTIAQVDATLPNNVGRQLVKMLLLEGLIAVN
ncbi:MAG: cupin domain-containing protein [Vulcanimicrobiaceae bacterium]|jgi:mannose-6-phosphate isomerase-like protein (cupin superfamily)